MNILSATLAFCTAIIQYYNYHLFSFVAVQISNYLMPDADITERLTNTYLIISLGMLGKPFTSFLLGKIGDIYGKYNTTLISLGVVAASSLVIALVPGYRQIGILAPLILLIAKTVINAFAAAGSDGIRLYVYEKINNNRKALGTGLVSSTSVIGSFLASLSPLIFCAGYMPDYGWRFTFVFGAGLAFLLIIAYLLLPHDLRDNQASKEQSYSEYKQISIFTLITQYWPLFTCCVLVAGAIGATYQFNMIFLEAYNSIVLQIIPITTMRYIRSAAIVLYAIFAAVGGLLADYWGMRKVATYAGIIFIAINILNIHMIANKQFSLAIYLLGSAMLPLITIPAITLIKQSIPLVIRYRIFSFSHALGSMLISGHTLLISNLLYQYTLLSWMPILYFVFMLCILIIGVNILHSKYSNPK